jgi:hypothetical protein
MDTLLPLPKLIGKFAHEPFHCHQSLDPNGLEPFVILPLIEIPG